MFEHIILKKNIELYYLFFLPPFVILGSSFYVVNILHLDRWMTALIQWYSMPSDLGRASGHYALICHRQIAYFEWCRLVRMRIDNLQVLRPSDPDHRTVVLFGHTEPVPPSLAVATPSINYEQI